MTMYRTTVKEAGKWHYLWNISPYFLFWCPKKCDCFPELSCLTKEAYHSWDRTKDIGEGGWNLNIHTLDKKIILCWPWTNLGHVRLRIIDPVLFSYEKTNPKTNPLKYDHSLIGLMSCWWWGIVKQWSTDNDMKQCFLKLAHPQDFERSIIGRLSLNML